MEPKLSYQDFAFCFIHVDVIGVNVWTCECGDHGVIFSLLNLRDLTMLLNCLLQNGKSVQYTEGLHCKHQCYVFMHERKNGMQVQQTSESFIKTKTCSNIISLSAEVVMVYRIHFETQKAWSNYCLTELMVSADDTWLVDMCNFTSSAYHIFINSKCNKEL